MSTSSTGRLGAVTASRTVVRDIGALQVLIGGLMLVPLLVD
jgi:trk system potassium uptake protein TrkH